MNQSKDQRKSVEGISLAENLLQIFQCCELSFWICLHFRAFFSPIRLNLSDRKIE